ncbi:MAG: diguanylate cyclase [Sphaerochaeta sp.]|nr:diguanylate cyclase [Sphaerochaeta sp.]
MQSFIWVLYEKGKETYPIKEQSITRRFIIGLVLILIALFVVGYIKLSLTTHAIETNRELSHTYDVITETKSLMRTFLNIRIAEQGYLLTGDRRYLQEIGVSSYSFDQHHTKLSILTRDDEVQQQRLEKLKAAFDELIVQAVQPMLAFRDAVTGEVSTYFEKDELNHLMEVSKTISRELETILDEIEKSEYELLAIRQQELDHWYNLDQFVTFFGPVIIILITFFAGRGAVIRLDRYRRQQERDQSELRSTRDRFASIIKGSNLGTWEWNIVTGTVQINDNWAALLGYTKEELEPVTIETFKRLTEPEDFERSFSQLQQHFSGQLDFYSCDVRMQHKDGHWVWILNRGQVITWDDQHNPVIMTGTHADISKRVADAQALARSEEENRKIFESMNQGFAYCQILLDENGVPNDFRILRVNQNFEVQTGLENKNAVGKRITEIIDVVEPYWFEYNGKVALTGQSMIFEAYNASLGRLFRISSFSPGYSYFVMIIDDITHQKETEAQLIYEKNLFETTLLSVGDGVISTDAHGNVQFMNKAAEILTGWNAEEAKGRRFEEIFKILYGKDRSACPNPVEQVLAVKHAIELEEDTILIARDGFERYIDDSAAPILDAEMNITGVVLVFRDSTEQRKKQHEILSLSFTDPLTTLNNRRYYDQVKHEVDSEPYYPLTLVVADVNGLKLTNDAFGHEAGDELLRKVAEVMRKTCREDDIISRIGGDEFVLLLPQTDALHAQAIVKRLNTALEKEHIKGIQVSVSFGYAVKEEGEDQFEDTFKTAEDVMYQNKLASSLSFKKQVISSLLERLFSQDPTLEEHSRKVADLAGSFARVLGYQEHEIQELRLAGTYHDLGKIAISPAIIKKSSSEMTRSENLEFKRHAEIGYNILRSVGEYASFSVAVLHHHERWDGNGYPQGLKHEAIPQEAQILAIANTYADFVGPRLHGGSVSEEEAIAVLRERKNTQFNPDLIETFITKVLNKA